MIDASSPVSHPSRKYAVVEIRQISCTLRVRLPSCVREVARLKDCSKHSFSISPKRVKLVCVLNWCISSEEADFVGLHDFWARVPHSKFKKKQMSFTNRNEGYFNESQWRCQKDDYCCLPVVSAMLRVCIIWLNRCLWNLARSVALRLWDKTQQNFLVDYEKGLQDVLELDRVQPLQLLMSCRASR